MTEQPAKDGIEIQLTRPQREHYAQQTGLSLPPSLNLPVDQLRHLSIVAMKAGIDCLPITRTAVRQALKAPDEQGRDTFVVEVSLTSEQKERVRQATGGVFASLRIVPDDVPVTYHETWGDTGQIHVGRTLAIKPANSPHKTTHGTQTIHLPTGDGSKRGVFGTGRHPTTQLSLILLEDYVASGDQVLDLGTGSGILAVAAARLGAGEVLALDTEAAAVAVARETVSLNALVGAVWVSQGGIESASPPYDVVAANIFPSAMVELAPQLAAAVRPGGVLITSGSVATRARETVDAVCPTGFSLEKRRTQKNWVGMAFRKR